MTASACVDRYSRHAVRLDSTRELLPGKNPSNKNMEHTIPHCITPKNGTFIEFQKLLFTFYH